MNQFTIKLRIKKLEYTKERLNKDLCQLKGIINIHKRNLIKDGYADFEITRFAKLESIMNSLNRLIKLIDKEIKKWKILKSKNKGD